MLTALLDHNGPRIAADDAERETVHVCPGCAEPVVLKRGRVKIAHFAHRAGVSCPWSMGETIVHMRAKTAFRDAFRQRGLRSEVEVVVRGLTGLDRRADVMVWTPCDRPIAVEIQHSPISLRDIERRTFSYVRARVPVLWVPVLNQKYLDQAESTDVWDLTLCRYPAPEWQRWIHGYGYGAMWFIGSDMSLWHAHLDTAWCDVPSSEWYESDGETQSAGGYSYPSRRWRRLDLNGPWSLTDSRLKLMRRHRTTTIGGHRYPGGDFVKMVIV